MKSNRFTLKELVPLHLYNLLHEDALWNLFDDRLLETLDTIKEKFPNGSIIINNYAWSGARTQSGIRTKNSKYYSEGSMHSVGKAVDMVFSKYTTDEVREYILENQDEFPHIGGLEKAEWLHCDVRPRRDGKIFLFNKNGIGITY